MFRSYPFHDVSLSGVKVLPPSGPSHRRSRELPRYRRPFVSERTERGPRALSRRQPQPQSGCGAGRGRRPSALAETRPRLVPAVPPEGPTPRPVQEKPLVPPPHVDGDDGALPGPATRRGRVGPLRSPSLHGPLQTRRWRLSDLFLSAPPAPCPRHLAPLAHTTLPATQGPSGSVLRPRPSFSARPRKPNP